MKQSELKFRAWNKKTKQMREVVSIDFELKRVMVYGNEEDHKKYIKDGGSISSGGFEESSLQMEWYFKDIVLMQFAGLKDKSKKRIYEKDIVEHGHAITVVMFKEGQFVGVNKGRNGWFIFRKDIEKKWGLDSYTHEDYPHKTVWKIIGNTYKNKELLIK